MLQPIQSEKDAQSVAEVLPPEQQPAKKKANRFFLFLKILLQVFLAFAVLFGAVRVMNSLVASKPEVAKRAIQEKAYVVKTTKAALGDHAPQITVYGEVLAAREVDLRTLVGGEVIDVHPNLKAGGAVQKDDILVAIDTFDYEGAIVEANANLAEARAALVESKGRVELERGNVERAREQLEFAQRDLERAEDLLGKGAVTERTVDDRKLVVSQRKQVLEQRQNALALQSARVDQRTATIKRLEWRLQDAERKLENTILKAPFNAIVRSAAAERGRLVSVNDAIVSLYDSQSFEVRFTLSDNQYGRLLLEKGTVIGRPVEVTWYLADEPIKYQAVITRIGADVASARGGVDVIASIKTFEENTPLRPGAFVEVTLSDRSFAQTFRIPETAFYGDGIVYVVNDNRLEPRNVVAVAIDDGHILVKGDLVDGETFLTTRIPEVGEGLLVEPIAPSNTQAPSKLAED